MHLKNFSLAASGSAALLACTLNAFAETATATAAIGNSAVETMDSVVVTGIRKPNETEQTEQTKQLSQVPAMMGDPMQTIFSLPGIVQANEAEPLPAVRGSGPDDNIFRVDSLPTGGLFHSVLGNSIFNENLLRDFGIHAAGFGANYGNATGAVFDISLREPRNQPIKTTVESSFLLASALFEGGISNKQAFYFSYRESMLHLVLPLLDKKDQTGLDDVNFTNYPRARDWQFKYTLNSNDYNRISFLSLGSQDMTGVNFGQTSEIALIDPGSTGKASISTKFNSQGLKWDFEQGANELHTAISNLDKTEMFDRGSNSEFLRLKLNEWQFKLRYAHNTHANSISAGIEQWYQKFTYTIHMRYRSCTSFTPDCKTDPGPLIDSNDSQIVRTSTVFAEDTLRLAEPWTVTAGVRYTRDAYLNENHTEPRIATQWQLNSNWNVHASWGQYHQLPLPEQILPEPGNPLLRSPTAQHYVFGVGATLNNGWSFTSDVYYKKLEKIVVDVDDDRNYVNAATGKAYGAELMINKNLTNRLQGWLSLSLSRTERHNDLTDTTARYDYDTPVNANLVLNYDLHHHWNAGLRWNYRSGFPYTPIIGNKENPQFPGYYIPSYGSLNSQRAHAYHRLDLHVGHDFHIKRLTGSVFIDIINAYNRKNGGSVQYKPVAGSSTYKLEESDSLPLIPSVGVKISF